MPHIPCARFLGVCIVLDGLVPRICQSSCGGTLVAFHSFLKMGVPPLKK
nr:MAG TPA: hypothetical protein [Caudoviricetes sp.]